MPAEGVGLSDTSRTAKPHRRRPGLRRAPDQALPKLRVERLWRRQAIDRRDVVRDIAGYDEICHRSGVRLATGGAISGVRYAVIWKDSTSAPARKLLACLQLSAASFTVADGHTL